MAFVDIGGKGEAAIEIAELKDADGVLEVAVGDRIQAMVVSTMGGLTLSRRLVRGAATDRQLEDAFHTGLPVEGKVEGEVKGYEVRIAPPACLRPISHRHATDRSGAHVGRVYEFKIVEYKEGGRTGGLPPRASSRNSSARAPPRFEIPGARRGLTGASHRCGSSAHSSHLGGGAGPAARVGDGVVPRLGRRQIVTPGEEITVKVLRVDEDAKKISLG